MTYRLFLVIFLSSILDILLGTFLQISNVSIGWLVLYSALFEAGVFLLTNKGLTVQIKEADIQNRFKFIFGKTIWFQILLLIFVMAKLYLGLDVKLILYAGAIFVLCFPLVYKFGLRPHQVERLDAYFTLLFHPSNLSEIYKNNLQVAQSMTAIGSGGALGKGWLRGTYSQYGFIFVSESDFIFSVAGEEFGFVGMSIIICLYIYFLLRLLTISILSKDFYGKLIGIGVFSLFFYQVVQNIGMTIGIIPVTGLPLPFVSYGGSSMISSMMCVALSLNVAKNKRKFDI